MIDYLTALFLALPALLSSLFARPPLELFIWFVTYVLTWILSCITIWMTLLAGNHHPRAWVVGLVNQALWLVYILVTHATGLLLLNAALWIVYGRNHMKWKRERAAAAT